MPRKPKVRFVALTRLIHDRYPALDDVVSAIAARRVVVDGVVATNPRARARQDAVVTIRAERDLRGAAKLPTRSQASKPRHGTSSAPSRRPFAAAAAPSSISSTPVDVASDESAASGPSQSPAQPQEECAMTGALSAQGLATLHELMAKHVAAGALPGLVTLVARGDEVSVDVIGTPSFATADPLRRDAIFRIASMTKPITAATAMSLVDDGQLRLDQPVDVLLPELADRRVLRSPDAALDDTVPAQRAITVEDLLSFRMGMGTVMAPPGAYPIQRAEAELGLQSIGGPPWPPVSYDPDGWIAALGSLPLVYQPGERWLYNTGSQVLGVLLARATGTDLPTLVRDRILEPLGMTATGFSVPAESVDRFTTTFYSPDSETGEISVVDDPSDSWWTKPPRFPDASGWLVSTIDDYWTFVSMLLDGGTHDGERILSTRSIALMTTDRLTPEQRREAALFLDGGGWGLGMTTPASGSSGQPLPIGFGWDGGSGTQWRTNADRGVTGILLTQMAMTSPEPPPLFDDFWKGVNAASQ